MTVVTVAVVVVVPVMKKKSRFCVRASAGSGGGNGGDGRACHKQVCRSLDWHLHFFTFSKGLLSLANLFRCSC